MREQASGARWRTPVPPRSDRWGQPAGFAPRRSRSQSFRAPKYAGSGASIPAAGPRQGSRPRPRRRPRAFGRARALLQGRRACPARHASVQACRPQQGLQAGCANACKPCAPAARRERRRHSVARVEGRRWQPRLAALRWPAAEVMGGVGIQGLQLLHPKCLRVQLRPPHAPAPHLGQRRRSQARVGWGASTVQQLALLGSICMWREVCRFNETRG